MAIHAQVSLSIGHLTANGDQSANQYKFVTVGASGVQVASGTTNRVIGVLANKPTAGQPCTIDVTGVMEVIAGASGIAAGDTIYLKADGTVTKVNTSTRVGTALEAATSGALFTALIDCADVTVGTV